MDGFGWPEPVRGVRDTLKIERKSSPEKTKMSDGREEREQREKQREQERWQDQADRVDRVYESDSQPEREDS